jgi:ketosteroid isomerase-like protein
MAPRVSGKPAEVVRGLYGDWSEGNFASSVDVFHPDVLFKSAVDDTPVRGVEAMATSIRDILSTVNEWTLHLEDLIEDGEHVVVRERQHAIGRTSRLPLITTLHVAFRVRDAQVTEALWFENRDDAIAAAGITGSQTAGPQSPHRRP